MIIYILLIVFFILTTIIAFGLTIAGIIKKNKKLWIGSLSSFVVLTLLTVLTIFSYVKETIDYMGTEEFQTETRKKAENWGKGVGNTVSGAAEGLESSLDEEAIAKLAEKSAKIIGSGIDAMSEGFDETLGKYTVFADESTLKETIKLGRADHIYKNRQHQFVLYLEFVEDLEGMLTLTSYDSEGLKMDNAKIVVNQTAGDEKIFQFYFEYFDPGISGYCILTYSAEVDEELLEVVTDSTAEVDEDLLEVETDSTAEASVN